MDDIVTRLANQDHSLSLMTEAANEIERLRKKIASLQVQKVIWREMCEEAQEQLQQALEHHYRLVD